MEKKDPATIALTKPIEHEGKTYTALTFRRMKARDALLAEGEESQIMAGYKLFAALADVPVDVILELDMADMEKVGEVAALQMGKSAAGPLDPAAS